MKAKRPLTRGIPILTKRFIDGKRGLSNEAKTTTKRGSSNEAKRALTFLQESADIVGKER